MDVRLVETTVECILKRDTRGGMPSRERRVYQSVDWLKEPDDDYA